MQQTAAGARRRRARGIGSLIEASSNRPLAVRGLRLGLAFPVLALPNVKSWSCFPSLGRVPCICNPLVLIPVNAHNSRKHVAARTQADALAGDPKGAGPRRVISAHGSELCDTERGSELVLAWQLSAPALYSQTAPLATGSPTRSLGELHGSESCGGWAGRALCVPPLSGGGNCSALRGTREQVCAGAHNNTLQPVGKREPRRAAAAGAGRLGSAGPTVGQIAPGSPGWGIR